jgi:hypothetical protein
MRMFTIKHDDHTPEDCPRAIPWVLIEPHQAQADINHGQTLEKLDKRSGLDAMETVAVLEDKKYWHRWPHNRGMRGIRMKEAAQILSRLVQEWSDKVVDQVMKPLE